MADRSISDLLERIPVGLKHLHIRRVVAGLVPTTSIIVPCLKTAGTSPATTQVRVVDLSAAIMS